MKTYILLIITLIAFSVSDFQLGKYAKGYQIFNGKLPFEFELKTDDNEGYKIVEEGFIHIISSNQDIKLQNGTELKVLKLLKYGLINNHLFVNVKTNKGNKVVEIKIDRKRAKGTQIVFSDIVSNEIIDWGNLEKNISFLSIFHFFCQILSIILILKILYNKLNRKKP